MPDHLLIAFALSPGQRLSRKAARDHYVDPCHFRYVACLIVWTQLGLGPARQQRRGVVSKPVSRPRLLEAMRW